MIKITVKCVGCGKKKEVGGEQSEMPFCCDCGSPMIAEKVKISRDKVRGGK